MIWVQRFIIRSVVCCAASALSLGMLGCSGERTQSGTMVTQTPEQLKAQQASMEGMRKAMANMKKGGMKNTRRTGPARPR